MRGLAFQVSLLFTIGSVIWAIASHVAQSGTAFGLDFLDTTAGFDIIQHLIPYSEKSTYGQAMLVGLLNTLLVAVLGIVTATLIGFVVGIGQLSQNWVISKLCVAYVEVVRNIPLLLQIFIWYFAVLRALPGPRESFNPFDHIFINNRGFYFPAPVPAPEFVWVAAAFALGVLGVFWLRSAERERRELTGQRRDLLLPGFAMLVLPPVVVSALTGFPMTFDLPELTGFNFEGGGVVIPELAALVLALSIYTASYIAEAVRAGIQGVPRGRSEAALALGLSRGQMLRLVVVPQALRQIIPPLTSQYLNLTKNSSLAVAIGYPDLVSVFAGTTLNQTGRAIEIIALTMGIYLTLSLLTSLFMNWYNARIALTER